MKRNLILIIKLICICAICNAQPPNNAVFNGGAGDGWRSAYLGTSSNNIFLGGSGDGWNVYRLNSSGNSIFLGGLGDGWHSNHYHPTPNLIFNGGIGDGWNTDRRATQSNSIFLGGIGDGWNAVAYSMGPLPVSLLSFTGEERGKTNILKWTTAQEVNVSHFELERSNNLNGYTLIHSVKAKGTSSLKVDYMSVDEQPFYGNNFYRLKMVDADGNYVYSNVILLRMLNNETSISVFPNPTADNLNVIINSSDNILRLQFRVFDNNGRLVHQQTITNSNSFSVDVKNYVAGIYLLKIRYNDQEEFIRFVKGK